jgi:glutamate 5-kinase
MKNLVRRELIETARTIVVKVGTNVLTRDDESLDVGRIETLVEQVCRILGSGRRVVVVSSGAVGAGLTLLDVHQRPSDLRHLQAAASVGQAHLIHCYDRCLQKHGYRAAQMLVTANDFKGRRRYLNVRNTLSTLFEYQVVPVVNENDTVSVEEIKFGDNDHLAAMVTNLLSDPLLVILTVVDGLYDGPPGEPASRVIPLVDRWDDTLLSLVQPGKSSRGTGGMQTKLEAVQTATAVGENVIIANGTQPDVLDRILAGEEVGTLFLAKGQALPAWKRWIGYTVAPKGRFLVDEGARRAVEQQGRSLLPIGVVEVQGKFQKGEVVSLVDAAGNEFARGLTNYDSRDAAAIAGKRTEDIAEMLSSQPYSELIHRDNLVVVS